MAGWVEKSIEWKKSKGIDSSSSQPTAPAEEIIAAAAEVPTPAPEVETVV